MLVDNINADVKLLHHVEQAAMEIVFYINAKKTEFIKFNQEGEIKSIKDGNDKAVVDFFVYLGSNIKSIDRLQPTKCMETKCLR